MQKFCSKKEVLVAAFKANAVYNSSKINKVLNWTFTCNFTFNATTQYFFQCFLWLFVRKWVEFGHLILIEFKMWSSNCSIIMTNIGKNFKYHKCGAVFPAANFWVTTAVCSGKFYVVFYYFKDQKHFVFNILKKILVISCYFYLKIV